MSTEEFSFKDFQALLREHMREHISEFYNGGFNESSNSSEDMQSAFNELRAKAYNYGYDLNANVDGDVKLEAIENACNMPKITV